MLFSARALLRAAALSTLTGALAACGPAISEVDDEAPDVAARATSGEDDAVDPLALPPFGDRETRLPRELVIGWREAQLVAVRTPAPIPPESRDTEPDWLSHALTTFIMRRRDAITSAERGLSAWAGEAPPAPYLGVGGAILGWLYEQFVFEVMRTTSYAIPPAVRDNPELREAYIEAVENAAEPMLRIAIERYEFCSRQIPEDVTGFIAAYREHCMVRVAALSPQRGASDSSDSSSVLLREWRDAPPPARPPGLLSGETSAAWLVPFPDLGPIANLRAPLADGIASLVAGASAIARGEHAAHAWQPFLSSIEGPRLSAWPPELHEELVTVAEMMAEDSGSSLENVAGSVANLFHESLELTPQGSGCAMARGFAAAVLISEQDRLVTTYRARLLEHETSRALFRARSDRQRARARSMAHLSGEALVITGYLVFADEGTLPDEAVAPLLDAIDAYVRAERDEGAEREAIRALASTLADAPERTFSSSEELGEIASAGERLAEIYTALRSSNATAIERASEEGRDVGDEALDWERFVEVCR